MQSMASDLFFSISFLDGKTAVRRQVEIQTIGVNFYLSERERRHGPFAFEDLLFISKVDDTTSYGHKEYDGWRITVSGPVPDSLQEYLPRTRKYGRWIDVIGIGPAAVAFFGISAAVVMVGLSAPQWLAPLIPQSVENSMSNDFSDSLNGYVCNTDAGNAALQKLTNSLDASSDDLQVEVVNIDMLNAVAMPGGKIFLFEGLIQQASSVDEVAGVLGHEIGHVRERHVMQSVLRQMGLSVIFGGANEYAGGALNSILNSSYGRDAEREADSHSIEVLDSANISPIPTKGFFEKLSDMSNDTQREDSIFSYMDSHPLSSERAAKFDASFDKDRDYQTALTEDEWRAIQSMCANDKDVKSGFGFDF